MAVLIDIAPAKQLEHVVDSFLSETSTTIDLTPTLLIQRGSPRRTHETSLDAGLADVTDTAAVLAHLMEKLQSLESSLKLRRSALMFARSPMSCLPTEIIQTILTLVVEPNVRVSANPKISKSVLSIRMSHVCARWRSVALGMPELWTLVEIPDDCPGMFEVFAARCSHLRSRRAGYRRHQPLEVLRSNRVVYSGHHPKNRFGFSFTDDQFRRIDSLTLGGRLSKSFAQRILHPPTTKAGNHSSSIHWQYNQIPISKNLRPRNFAHY